MEDHEKRNTGEADILAEAHDVQAIVNLPSSTPDRDGQGRCGHGTSQGAQLGGRAEELASSALESSSAEIRDRQWLASHLHGGPAGSAGSDAESSDRRHAAALQICQAADHGSHGGVDTVSDHHLATPGGRSPLEHAQSMDRTGVLAHIGLPPAKGSAGVRQSHPADLEPALTVIPGLKALLRLILHNPSNLCYLHSTIFAVHWTMLQARLHDAHVPPPPQVFTMLCPPAASNVTTPASVQVLQSLPWLLMLRAWRDVHRQHDVAEFAMYLIPRISPMGMHGCWEARNYAPRGTVTLDSGSLAVPLPIVLEAGADLHLQQSVEGWSAQATARYAMCDAPKVLCLQLMRFRQQGETVHKDSRGLQGLRGVVHMPRYTGANTLSTALVPYQVAAVQHHYGATPETGHYRTKLYGQKLFAPDRCWLTDDASCAQPTHPNAHSDTAYIIWLCQVDSDATARS